MLGAFRRRQYDERVVAGTSDITIQSGRCWWCQAPADSREHRWKASDVVREYGKPPYNELRTLTRFSGADRHVFRGPKSGLVKFTASLCSRCNNTRSQPFDYAWDEFVTFVAEREAQILGARAIDWFDAFGASWKSRGADVERYVLKHIICRLIDEAPPPITLAGEYLAFLEGEVRPQAMEIELAIDIGIVGLLRATRAAPSPEQPPAADAGFLGTTPLFVQGNQSTGQWREPWGGLYYRYMGIRWRLGAGSATPFERRVITLVTTDEFFGPAVSEALAGK